MSRMIKEKILIFGAGTQLQSTIDIIELEGKYAIAGLVDSKAELRSNKFGYQVVGRQENVQELIQTYDIKGGIISVGDNWIRKFIYDDIRLRAPSLKFINAIHPSVIISERTKIGNGVVFMAGCIVNPGAVVGDQTFFATGAQIEHDCIIGDFASVSAGSVLGGLVNIGRYSAITLNVTVVDRINIGENTVVGSGSLVLHDIPDNVLVYGSPAKIVRERKPKERFLK